MSYRPQTVASWYPPYQLSDSIHTMSWFGTPHFGRALQTHARHEPQASGAVSLLSAIATALSTAATAALEVVVVRPALVALLDEGLRAA